MKGKKPIISNRKISPKPIISNRKKFPPSRLLATAENFPQADC
jgi:hypothetical protein